MSASFRKKSWIVFKLKGFSKPNIIENSVQITENNSTKIGQKKKREKKKRSASTLQHFYVFVYGYLQIY